MVVVFGVTVASAALGGSLIKEIHTGGPPAMQAKTVTMVDTDGNPVATKACVARGIKSPAVIADKTNPVSSPPLPSRRRHQRLSPASALIGKLPITRSSGKASANKK